MQKQKNTAIPAGVEVTEKEVVKTGIFVDLCSKFTSFVTLLSTRLPLGSREKETKAEKSIVQMDNKYCVCLKNFLSNEILDLVTSLHVSRQKHGKIVLEPIVEFPVRKNLIYKSEEELASLGQSIDDDKEAQAHLHNLIFGSKSSEEKEHVQD